jgi:hypothetical protein
VTYVDHGYVDRGDEEWFVEYPGGKTFTTARYIMPPIDVYGRQAKPDTAYLVDGYLSAAGEGRVVSRETLVDDYMFLREVLDGGG